MEGIWPLVTVIGPILLLAVLVWVFLKNRNASRRDVQRTEDATRRMYDEQARADNARDAG